MRITRPHTTILTIFILISLPPNLNSLDLSSDTAALLALRAAVRGRTFLWNISSPPCSWDGVTCQLERVTELRLPGMGLSGQLPAGPLGNLSQLQTLSLRFNSLSGQLPADLALIAGLRNLYLQGNSFSGEIPLFLYSLTNLIRLNLAGNKFSGEISPNVNNLTRLGTLYLEDNQLTGSIPELILPKLEQFNVSNNRLNGSIPSRVSKMNKSSFEGNTLCGGPLKSCSGDDDNVKGGVGGGGDKGLSGGAIAGIVIGSVLGFLLLLLILFLCCRKRTSKKTESRDVEAEKKGDVEVGARDKTTNGGGGLNGGTAAAAAAPVALAAVGKKGDGKNEAGNKSLVFFGDSPRNFDLEDLLRASAEVLGKGTFGTAYKASLQMGLVVAVKRLKDVVVPAKEFAEKIAVVGGLNHQNLVLLRAYYYTDVEKLIVCDYLPMGSLSALLHGNRGAGRTPLNWETRSGIALGTARGIEYIHSQGSTSSHGNIKSSNILLTKSFEARISDFGLTQFVAPSSTPNRIAGYRAPEVTDPRQVSQKGDVYSFGVLILELLTGKAPTHTLLNEEGVDLPRWVMSVVREEWSSEVFDLELLRYQNVEEEMVQLLQLALSCTVQYPANRPTMSEVVKQIEELCRSSSTEQDISIDSGAPST